MLSEFPLMIPGARPAGTLEVANPYDGALIASVETADRAAADKALDMAHRLYCNRRGWLSKQKRIRVLLATAGMINDHTAFRVDWMPFAGHMTSGLGTGGIGYAMREMQSGKLIVIRSDAL